MFKQPRLIYLAGGETPRGSERSPERPAAAGKMVRQKLAEYTKKFNDFKKDLEESLKKEQDDQKKERMRKALNELESIMDPDTLDVQSTLSMEQIGEQLEKFQRIIDEYESKKEDGGKAKEKTSQSAAPKAAPAVKAAPRAAARRTAAAPEQANRSGGAAAAAALQAAQKSATTPEAAPQAAQMPEATSQAAQKSATTPEAAPTATPAAAKTAASAETAAERPANLDLESARAALRGKIAEANNLARSVNEQDGQVPPEFGNLLIIANTIAGMRDTNAMQENIAKLETQMAAMRRANPSAVAEKTREGNETPERQELRITIRAAQTFLNTGVNAMAYGGALMGFIDKAISALRKGNQNKIEKAQIELSRAFESAYKLYSEKTASPLTMAQLREGRGGRVTMTRPLTAEQRLAQAEREKAAKEKKSPGPKTPAPAGQPRVAASAAPTNVPSAPAAAPGATASVAMPNVASSTATPQAAPASVPSEPATPISVPTARFSDVPATDTAQPNSPQVAAVPAPKGSESPQKTGEAPAATAPENAKTTPAEHKEREEKREPSAHEKAWTYMSGELKNIPEAKRNDEGFRCSLSYQIESNPKAREIVQNILLDSTIVDTEPKLIKNLSHLLSALRAKRESPAAIKDLSMKILCERIAEQRFYDLEISERNAITKKAIEEFTAASANEPLPYRSERIVTHEGINWRYRALKRSDGRIDIEFERVRAGTVPQSTETPNTGVAAGEAPQG